MAYLSIALPAGAQQFLLASRRNLAGLFRRSAPDAPVTSLFHAAEEILDQHLRLDDAIDQRMDEVIGETGSSALAVMQQVRQLHDTSTGLVSYLDGTSLDAGDLGRDIVESMASLAELGTFIEKLPAKMENDLHNVRMVVKEIKELSGLTEAVQAISMQSHLLAINAAIEASRAGSGGAAFRVVADEMRALASNSGAVAQKINQGLARAHKVVEHGMAAGIQESTRQLDEVSTATGAISKLRGNFEDMGQYFKTRFGVVTKHNQDLARDIAEVLGQMQTQDVVRQRIERMQQAMERRNGLLRDAVNGLRDPGGADPEPLAQQLALVREDYVAGELKHQHSTRDVPDAGAGLKIELF